MMICVETVKSAGRAMDLAATNLAMAFAGGPNNLDALRSAAKHLRETQEEWRASLTALEQAQATPAEIEAARDEYASDEIEIDDDALASRPDEEEGLWVQAWLWVRIENEPEEDDE